MLKLKLQYFGRLMPRADSKGAAEDEMVSRITDSMDKNLSKL